MSLIQTAKRVANVEEYYFSRKLAEVRSLDSPEWRVINLGIGSPDLAPPQPAIEALVASSKQGSHHGYQPYKGIPDLRKAISNFYQRTYGVALDPETMVLPLMGSKEGILHISMAFLNEDDEVLVPDPGYPTYASVARLVGAKVRPYAMKEALGWKMDLEELSRQDFSKVKIMWVNFPHMPTGSTATRNELQALVELARKHEFLIINDNPYSLILNEDPTSILGFRGADEVAMELNSLSKSHNMAGWRLGWVAGRKEYVDAVLQVRSNMDSGMFLSIQHAAIEALKSENSWFENLNDAYRERASIAADILRLLGCTFSEKQSGLFIWAKVSEPISDVEKWIDEILYQTRIFITPGFVFGEAGKRFIRISLCSPSSKLSEARERLKQWMGIRDKERSDEKVVTV